MFGHQNGDENATQNSTNPALPGSFPAIPSPTGGADQPFNPALPSSNAPWSNNNANPPSPSAPDESVANNPPANDISPLINTGSNDDLLDIKQKALSQLSPLVSHLEQTPEEKFRTTMMMIQATDNQDLVKDAYAAAQTITDEKAKAQALLDIVNEINYFTQHHQS